MMIECSISLLVSTVDFVVTYSSPSAISLLQCVHCIFSLLNSLMGAEATTVIEDGIGLDARIVTSQGIDGIIHGGSPLDKVISKTWPPTPKGGWLTASFDGAGFNTNYLIVKNSY